MLNDSYLVAALRWATQRFPSLPEYLKSITPILIFGFSVATVLFNILPKPGYKYPIPNKDDIRRELSSANRLLYYFVLLSRYLAIFFNSLTDTKAYCCFYRFVFFWSELVVRFKGDKLVSQEVKITRPPVFYVNLYVRKDKSANDNDE